MEKVHLAAVVQVEFLKIQLAKDFCFENVFIYVHVSANVCICIIHTYIFMYVCTYSFTHICMN